MTQPHLGGEPKGGLFIFLWIIVCNVLRVNIFVGGIV